jgi:hypothetical protein
MTVAPGSMSASTGYGLINVDGRAGNFVDCRNCRREVSPMAIKEAIGQGDLKLSRNAACSQFADELAHTNEKLACGKFCESHCGYRLRRNALREHESDTASHDGGLPRAGSGFHKE